jgi:hypothetical protein
MKRCVLVTFLIFCHALFAAAQIETPFLRFTLIASNGACEIFDKQAQVSWQNDAAAPRFGWVRLNFHEQSHRVDLRACDVRVNGKELRAAIQLFGSRPLTLLHVMVRALQDQKTLEFSYQEDNELEIESVSLLDEVLGISDAAQGFVVVPVREGLLVPADSGLSFTRQFDTYAYEGCHMTMLGVAQKGAAALLTWDDPYVMAELRSSLGEFADGAHQRLAPSLVLSRSARTFRVSFLGRGDHVVMAQAYRETARQKGWLVTWDKKLKENPTRAKLFGAANIKLWSALDRRMNPESTREESVHVNWTFNEAAQVAEHFKNDLRLDRVLFTLGGWIHRGYDNQHPDILPTAPECGGDKAFSDCARRVLNLGYLFCLHDNYQDIYRDSPSWSEKLIIKNDDGKLVRGGRWAGGQAYLVCSQRELELARRKQNLPSVKRLSSANAYFIDTTYASPLQECYDPSHALTRGDDMKWKQALSDYARRQFGIFGSECGREWAVPHCDFFEGLTGVGGHPYHDQGLPAKLGATVVPLFDLVYHDCIAMYGKYGYDPQQAAGYVLEHVSLARPLNYHAIPSHLYWKLPSQAPSESTNAAALFTRADNGWASGLHPLDRFIKNTYEILSPLNELTARLPMTTHEFLTSDRKVQRTRFGSGTNAMEIVVNFGTTNFSCSSRIGGEVVIPENGFLAEGPTFVAFRALSWNGIGYAEAPLFTLRSLDEVPLERARKMRIFHGFGPEQIRVGNVVESVPREGVVDLGNAGKKGNP